MDPRAFRKLMMVVSLVGLFAGATFLSPKACGGGGSGYDLPLPIKLR